MLEKSELEQLDRAWTVIRIIWGALFASLVVYLLVGKSIEDQLEPMGADFPLATMKIALFGVSLLTFFITFYVRKTMLKISVRSSPFVPDPSMRTQHPAAGKYLIAIIVAMALSESIGIYGLVLFFMGKDSAALYQFTILSAMSMFYFRPRKEELLQVAAEMQKQRNERRA